MNNSKTPIIISIIAAIIATFSCIASWWGTMAAVNKNTAELQAKADFAWQARTVYYIIDDGSKNRPLGMTFEEIRQVYISKAIADLNIKFSKKDLQPEELKTVLLSMMETKLVHHMVTDTYMAGKSTAILGLTKSFEVDRATGSILIVLSTRGGELTVAGMEPLVVNETKVTKEDFHTAINGLISSNAVSLDANGKLWSVANPQPKNKK